MVLVVDKPYLLTRFEYVFAPDAVPLSGSLQVEPPPADGQTLS